ncbi:hypothetical protein [Akkermansia sp.]|uniref:hypothetical protein n=1 Tax=Akkermansia sp. TaxID=1872421 RepID=UPI0025BA3DC3|nr:hypothetical protein [Akkermansia sp.]MCC8148582.1 hypothetical protein [Akkermansia sp.]
MQNNVFPGIGNTFLGHGSTGASPRNRIKNSFISLEKLFHGKIAVPFNLMEERAPSGKSEQAAPFFPANPLHTPLFPLHFLELGRSTPSHVQSAAFKNSLQHFWLFRFTGMFNASCPLEANPKNIQIEHPC